MFVKATGIMDICGDYVAFHEMGFYDEYIFGDLFFVGDELHDVLMTKLELDWNDENTLENQDKETLDKLAKEWIDNFEYDGEYHDYGLSDCVVETDNNGKVLNIYWKN